MLTPIQRILKDAFVSVAIVLVLFAGLLALKATPPALLYIPIGIGAVWFLAQTIRRSRTGGPKGTNDSAAPDTRQG